ncbi:MAG: hypothetical protein PWQ67_1859 [Clostridia bacterium]|jgi:uncharacterized membrane protein YcaP (DUF421 family)|nr:hypothetical protein [Clostridia bacterium]MDN5323405.1 hypothetical protein [Clostridia bacterium]
MIYLEITLKAILTYILMLIFMKVIGKAGFAQMTPYDLTFVLIVAAVLGVPLTNPNSSYTYSLIVFIVGLVMQQLFSRLSLKNKIRPWVENKPTVIIVDGKIVTENMKSTQFDMVQLLAALRLKGIRNIEEVELGTLEPGGDFSVITKKNTINQESAKSTYLSLKEETLKTLKSNQ